MSGGEFEAAQELYVVLAIISALIMISNAFMIVVIARNKSLLDVTGCLMISLALADFGVGVSLATPLVYSIFSDQFSHVACDAIGFINSVTWVVSVYNLMLLSADRFMAIARPFDYTRLVSLSRCSIAAIMVWVFSIILWVFPLAGLGSFKFNDEELTCYFDMAKHPTQWIVYMCIIFGPTSVVILVCYSKIFIISYRQKRRIENSGGQEGQPSNSNNTKAVRTLAVIIGAFYLAWFPFVVEHIVKAVKGSLEQVPEWLEIAIYVLAASNSFWNPLIYVGTNKKFRAKCLQTLKKAWQHCVCRAEEAVEREEPSYQSQADV